MAPWAWECWRCPGRRSVQLGCWAWGRSGDKGDKANIGIIARRPEYLPWLWAALTPEVVAARFAHFVTGGVERFLLPGPPAINFLQPRFQPNSNLYILLV